MQKFSVLVLIVICGLVAAFAQSPTTTPMPLEITSTTMGWVTQGQKFEFQLQVKGGTPPYTYEVDKDALPPCFVLNKKTGKLTASEVDGPAETYAPDITVTDSKGKITTKELLLTIRPFYGGKTNK